MDFQGKIFCLKKGLSWWFQGKELLLATFSVMQFPSKLNWWRIFPTLNFLLILSFFLYLNQGTRRSCPGASCVSYIGTKLVSNFPGAVYENFEDVPGSDPCKRCFCNFGEIVCSERVCEEVPPGFEGCRPLPVPEGACCPQQYECCKFKKKNALLKSSVLSHRV